MYKLGPLTISTVVPRILKLIVEYWAYEQETRYSPEEITRWYPCLRSGLVYRCSASHSRRTGWTGRSRGRSYVHGSPACRGIGTGMVLETLLQELRGDGRDRSRFA